MKKLNIVGGLHTGVVCKCLERDKVPGKPYCIYKEGVDKSKQPKGFPKHFKTKGEAEDYVVQMKMFEDITKRKSK